MKNFFLILFFFFLCATYNQLNAQENLEIFGYGQGSFLQFENRYDPHVIEYDDNYTYKNMGITQLNLLMSRSLGDELTAFINFELTNNFDSERGFGSFYLQEAYLRWNYKDYLNLKFGMVIPKFNNLYEIYNKTPLIPYLIRPKIYEVNWGTYVDLFDYLPQKALLQVYGSFISDEIKFDYAFYCGNPPNSFLSSKDKDLIPGYVEYGQSAVNLLAVGGRIGIRTDNIKAGFSFAKDKENRREIELVAPESVVGLGDLDRYKLGFDASFEFGDFNIVGEYLLNKVPLTNDQQDSLDYWSSIDPAFTGNGLNKYFYYVSAMYTFSEKFYSFIMFDYIQDKLDAWFFGNYGYYGYHIGCGYYMNENVVLKGQVTLNKANYNTGLDTPFPAKTDYREIYYAIGASFSF
ncbi:MAG: hypothetical protein Q8M94_12310 [Ignavibacteria bacterium]|nr:hypothetical protein [Ignavibacteria bacterium]